MPVLRARLAAQPGPCRTCRHANQGTVDFSTGYLACNFKGGLRPDAVCDLAVRSKSTGQVQGYCFEPFDGQNGTWGMQATFDWELP